MTSQSALGRNTTIGRPALLGVAVALALALMAVPQPAAAQSKYGPLFDKFAFKVAGSFAGLTTEIRVDSETLGTGTKLNFEDDLNLDSNKVIPTFGFDWQIARKHKLSLRYQDINRSATSQSLTEIRWGDQIIPIDSNINLGYDIKQTFLDYAYYPWVNEKWAAGFGIGVRVMEVKASLTYTDEEHDITGSTEAKGSGPLPYLYFEYRRMLSDRWRFQTGLGWLSVTVGDISGSQWVSRASFEYLLGERWGFGAALNLSTINVDWSGLENEEGNSVLKGSIKVDINDITFFARLRF